MKRNILIILVLIALSSLLITYRGGSASYGVFYACIVIPLISMIYLIYVYTKFRIYQSIDKKTLVKGSKINYNFDIANEDIVAYTSLKVEFETDKITIDDFDTKKTYCLMPEEKLEYRTTISCKYCGKYEIGVKNVVIKDFLRLFSLNYKVDNMIMVNVYPRMLELPRLIVAPNDADSKSPLDYFAINKTVPDNQIKLYEPGEPAKRIHFKASAHMGKLLSKRYTDEPKAKITMMVSTKLDEENELVRIKTFDKILEGTIAIANYFYRENLAMYTYYDLDGIQELYVHSKATFNNLYELYKENKFDGNYSARDMFEYSIGRNSSQNYFIIITPHVDEELMKFAYENRRVDGMTTIVYVGDEDIAPYRDIDEHIKVVKISLDSDIEKVLTGEDELC